MRAADAPLPHDNRACRADAAALVRRAWLPALVGWIAGTMAQVGQSALWPAPLYGALACLGAVGTAAAVWRGGAWRSAAVAVA
ncbi:MAG: hypothetical protein ACUVVU_04165, partial [Tepidimonas sp.]